MEHNLSLSLDGIKKSFDNIVLEKTVFINWNHLLATSLLEIYINKKKQEVEVTCAVQFHHWLYLGTAFDLYKMYQNTPSLIQYKLQNIKPIIPGRWFAEGIVKTLLLVILVP